jgi:hypothetical protein
MTIDPFGGTGQPGSSAVFASGREPYSVRLLRYRRVGFEGIAKATFEVMSKSNETARITGKNDCR